MNYYVVSSIAGSMGGITANVPNGTNWAGAYNSATNDYLIASPSSISGLTPLTNEQLQQEIQNRGLTMPNIEKWAC